MNILQNDSIHGFESVVIKLVCRLDSLEYDELDVLLLVHNKVLSGSHGEPFFIFGLLHT